MEKGSGEDSGKGVGEKEGKAWGLCWRKGTITDFGERREKEKGKGV